MIRSQLVLDVNKELIADNFAGGGGASTGIELGLGRHVDHAVNHDQFALGMHRINHAQTVHHCEDIFDVDPAKMTGGRRVGLGWFSPDCKHFSKAKGGKPLDKKIRGLVLVILRWAAIRTRVIYMENVEEIQTWGPLFTDHNHGCKGVGKCKENCHHGRPIPEHKGRTWKAFIAALGSGLDPAHPDVPEILEVLGGTITKAQLAQGFGYHIETKEIRACDFGAPTIRKRLFMIARCDGLPIVWPQPTHFSPADIAGKKGKKPWRVVAECIDWERPCPSIFLTSAQAKKIRCIRPLAKSTERRIAVGVDRHVIHAKEPFFVSNVAPFVSDANRPKEDRTASADDPMRTLCSGIKGGHFQVVAPVLAREFGESIGQRVDSPAPTVMPHGQGKTSLISPVMMQRGHYSSNSAMVKSATEPMQTQAAAEEHVVIAANLFKLRGDVSTHSKPKSANDPLDAVSASGTHHALSACYLAQHNTGVVGHDARKPISTISQKGSQQQIVAASLTAYYGSETDSGQPVNQPLRTVTTKERFGLATATANAPLMTEADIAGARRVAKFLRKYGVEFEGEFATVAGFVIVDIGMRMLTPRELFRAQGFPEAYVIDRAWLINPKTGALLEAKLNKSQQIYMCGNSVCPPVASALVAANSADMSAYRKGERRRVARELQTH